jgi:hypothetical protein
VHASGPRLNLEAMVDLFTACRVLLAADGYTIESHAARRTTTHVVVVHKRQAPTTSRAPATLILLALPRVRGRLRELLGNFRAARPGAQSTVAPSSRRLAARVRIRLVHRYPDVVIPQRHRPPGDGIWHPSQLMPLSGTDIP